MTEVRSIGDSNKGLFAKQDYREGDVIVVESEPILRLLSGTEVQEASFFEELTAEAFLVDHKTGKKSDSDDLRESFASSLAAPDDLDKHVVGKFRSMVQVAVAYAILSPDDSTNKKLLSLYNPLHANDCVNEEREATINTARRAISFLKQHAKGAKLKQHLQDEERLCSIMLVWCCNAFEGGRIYDMASRINHSCNPTAVVRSEAGNENVQSILAATAVNAGDEITISYLGTMLYADRQTRQTILRQDKLFTCQCTRCSDEYDLAARVPCIFCQPRPKTQQQLDEDVQYDDERMVKYMVPSKDGVYKCEYCNKILEDTDSHNVNLNRTINAVSRKVSAYLQDCMSTQSKGASSIKRGQDEDEDELVQQTLCQQHLELASSFLGASHWTTNLLMLMELTSMLERHHASLLDTAGDDDDPDGAMETVAQGIDMLERLIRFVDGLNLKLHRGHLLSDMFIGIARALVSFGDLKSQKYAAEWIEKVDDYVEKFESEGMQRVVQALRTAWNRDEKDHPTKRMKI